MSRSHALPPMLASIAMFSLACTQGEPAVHEPTNAVIEDLENFNYAYLTGSMEQPHYPIGIPYTGFDTGYVAILKAANPARDPFDWANVVFYPGEGGKRVFQGQLYPCYIFDCNNGRDSARATWQTDVEGFKKATIQGNYSVGVQTSYTLYNRDFIDVYGRFYSEGSEHPFVGEGTLLWHFISVGSTIGGSSSAVFPDESFWVQASSVELPAPLSFAWSIDGNSQSWSGPFVYTHLSGHGSKTIGVRITGANSQYVDLEWQLFIKCPPPDFAFADECGNPPQ